MWLWKRLDWPLARRRAVSSMSGLRKPSAASGWQWEAGGELTAAGGKLDDAVGFRIGESLEGGVDGDDRRDVYGRIGVVALLGGIEHRGVLLGRCNRHNLMSVTGHLAKGRRILAGFAAFARAENSRFLKRFALGQALGREPALDR